MTAILNSNPLSFGNDGPVLSSFHQSASNGDLASVMETIDSEPVFLNEPCMLEYGRSPLHEASINDHVDICEVLLLSGANIEALDQGNGTPLHDASRCGSYNVLKFLIKKGANVNIKNKDGETPLHLALREGNSNEAQLLMSSGADLFAEDNDGDTPLHCACDSGLTTIAFELLKLGANPNSFNSSGESPLHYSCSYIHEIEENNNNNNDVEFNNYDDSDFDIEEEAPTFDYPSPFESTSSISKSSYQNNKQMSTFELVSAFIKYGGDLFATSEDGETAIDLVDDESSAESLLNLFKREQNWQRRKHFVSFLHSMEQSTINKCNNTIVKISNNNHIDTESASSTINTEDETIRIREEKDTVGMTAMSIIGREIAMFL